MLQRVLGRAELVNYSASSKTLVGMTQRNPCEVQNLCGALGTYRRGVRCEEDVLSGSHLQVVAPVTV